jgi:D-arabinose 1-dehydrogenase-like Zn-dependent alcohol dehydrogenase
MVDCLAPVVTEFNEQLELQRASIPELARSSVLMRVEAATLCGTDTDRFRSFRNSNQRDDDPAIAQ